MLYPGSYLTEEMIQQLSTDGTWANVDLYQLLEKAANENPDRLAVVSYKEETGEIFKLTYRKLWEKVNRLAYGLRNIGIQPGDVVSVQLPNWWEFAVICFATLKIGAVINGLTPIYRHKEVSFIMSITESKLIFIPKTHRSFNHLEMMLELSPQLPALEKIIVVDQQDDAFMTNENILPFQSLLEEESKADDEQIMVDPNRLAQLGFTSGTTGEPKGVMHTHNTLEATFRNFISHMNLKPAIRNLVVSPVGHQTGFLWGTLLTVRLNGTIVYLDIWKAKRAHEVMKEQNITTMIAAYPFLHDIAMLDNIEQNRPNSLELVCIPGAPIPRHMVKYCAEKLNCTVAPAWGMTEYGIALAVSPSDNEYEFITDGRLLPGAKARILDDQGQPVSAGEEGNLQIKGAGLFIGYYKRPHVTQANFSEDGWFNTGDRVVQNENGFIAITGRTKDIIIRGGENIPVAEIENLLLQWDKVKDVAIVAMPDERLGEKACAYVVPAVTSFTFEDMIQYLLGKGIAKQKLPERLEFIDELPRTASGKVQKFILRNDIKQKLQSAQETIQE